MRKQLLALAVCAGSITMAEAETKAQTGMVFGIQAGYSEGYNPPNDVTISGINFSSNSDNGNFNFGGLVGYDFALNDRFSIGVEADLNYTNNIATVNVSDGIGSDLAFKLNAFNMPFMATAKFFAPNGVNFFVKGGLNYQTISNTGTTCSGGFTCSDDQSDSSWTGVIAGGIGYQIEDFNIFAQYMYIFGDSIETVVQNNDSSTLAQSIITGGVSYTLPL